MHISSRITDAFFYTFDFFFHFFYFHFLLYPMLDMYYYNHFDLSLCTSEICSYTDWYIPNKTVSETQIPIIEALKTLNFVKSNGEARRLIRGNGAKVNDVIINDEDFILSAIDFQNQKVKISSGKKKHGLLILKQI